MLYSTRRIRFGICRSYGALLLDMVPVAINMLLLRS